MNIEIHQITKKYNQQVVLDQIDLSVSNIHAIGIIGESGCGKSTLLRQLAGIEDVDNGEIMIDGLSPTTNKIELQNKIGYVFQKHNLFPHLTVRQNLSLLLEKIKKISKQDANKIIDEVLHTLKIKDIENKLPRQISGGQAQRASIARALSSNASLLFLDEPTAALDPLLSNEVLKSVQQLRDTGIDFIFITHEIEFLRGFADYVLYMDKGKIIEHGPIHILDNPHTKKLQTFMQK